MQVVIRVDKTMHPSPANVRDQLKSLRRWRHNRDRKDLPCGDLDRTIHQLVCYERFLREVYEVELNQSTGEMPTCE